jgi:hypothetical protein
MSEEGKTLEETLDVLKRARRGVLGGTRFKAEEFTPEWWPEWAQYIADALNAIPELMEAAQKQLERPKAQVVVVSTEPGGAPMITTEGEVEVFDINLGRGFDLLVPRAEDAHQAMLQASIYAGDASRLEDGPARQAIETAVKELVEVFGGFEEGLARLGPAAKARLEPFLPKMAEVEVGA